jgi:hypothetical protein
MTAQLLRGVSHADYHRDVIAATSSTQGAEDATQAPPRLSRSIATRLLNESPLKAWAAHPRLGGQADADTAATGAGSLFHALLAGGEGPQFVRVDADDYRTNKAKDARDAALRDGFIPVLARVLDGALAVVGPLVAQLDEETDGAWSEADKEVTALWDANGTACKARLDALHLGRGLIMDPKFTYSAHPDGFGRSMRPNGYDLQQAFSIAAVEAAHPELAGRVGFQFILVEVDHGRMPVQIRGRFVTSLPRVGETMADLGRQRMRRAISLWRRCLEDGYWPSYDTSNPIEARSYELEDEMSHQLAASEAAADWAEGAGRG